MKENMATKIGLDPPPYQSVPPSLDMLPHSDNVVGKVNGEGDLACMEEVGDKELIKILSRDDGHHSAGVVEIGNDGGLVFELINREVDKAKWPPFLRWQDMEDDR